MKVIDLEARRGADKKEKIKGIEFCVTVSPYFFPERLECRYDAEQGCVIIDFKYLDEEASRKMPAGDVVTLFVGEHSERLMSIWVKVDKHNLDRVRMLVTDQAISAIRDTLVNQRAEAPEHYDTAEEVLREHGQEIAQAVAVG